MLKMQSQTLITKSPNEFVSFATVMTPLHSNSRIAAQGQVLRTRHWIELSRLNIELGNMCSTHQTSITVTTRWRQTLSRLKCRPRFWKLTTLHMRSKQFQCLNFHQNMTFFLKSMQLGMLPMHYSDSLDRSELMVLSDTATPMQSWLLDK